MSRQRSWTRHVCSNSDGTGGSLGRAAGATGPGACRPYDAGMQGEDPGDALEPLLAEQLAYYRAGAPEYGETAIPELGEGTLRAAADELAAAVEAFGVAGDVLELACGPGTCTGSLLRGATSLTAVDGAPEMLEIARAAIGDERVRFVEADIFEWTPDRRYDCVCFGFWLSHVPLERFESFWAIVAGALKPDGRVLFIDDGYRTEDELIEGPESSTIRRTLGDGSTYRWSRSPTRRRSSRPSCGGSGGTSPCTTTSGPFYWGDGGRGRSTPRPTRRGSANAVGVTRIAVTGGSGKAGRAVVQDLLEHGHDVLNIDRGALAASPVPPTRRSRSSAPT